MSFFTWSGIWSAVTEPFPAGLGTRVMLGISGSFQWGINRAGPHYARLPVDLPGLSAVGRDNVVHVEPRRHEDPRLNGRGRGPVGEPVGHGLRQIDVGVFQ